MIKLSIVIPVYKVENYISKCLDSVVYQEGVSFKDYEVIIVNDGSPDRSIDIINAYDWNGCKYRIINQANKGLSGARNAGLHHSKGEYIWFVDSDDIISAKAVGTILKYCDNNDIINIAYCKVIDGVEEGVVTPPESDSGSEIVRKGIPVQAQFHIFRKEFLDQNKLSFMEGIYHEDMEFTPRCAYLAEKICSINDCLYYYQMREGSIMTTPNPKRAFDYLIVASSLIDFSKKNNESMQSTPLSRIICMSINNALSIIKDANYDVQKEWNKVFFNNPSFIEALSASDIKKYKIEGRVLAYTSINAITLYKILQLFNRKNH